MIFYEAPHKLLSTLKDLRDTFGAERRISLCRELTKRHEEVRRTTLGEAVDWYEENQPKGEFVLIVEGAEPAEEEPISLEEGVRRARELYASGVRMKDAVKQVAKETGLPKNELYQLSVTKE